MASIISRLKQAYGFAANPALSVRANACLVLKTMSPLHYHTRPTHLAFHDLTTYIKPPPNLKSLLGLGLKFVPTPNKSNNYPHIRSHSLDRLERSLHLKFFFAGRNLQESNYNPRIYISSGWTPPNFTWPGAQLNPRLKDLAARMKQLFRPRPGITNLLPHQSRALEQLQNNPNLLVVPTDKNLGPAIIERDRYIALMMSDHLNNVSIYSLMSPARQNTWISLTKDRIKNWITKHKKLLSKSDKTSLRTHLRNNTKPFGRFYGTLKVHKLSEGKPLSSRPIVSCPGSLLYPLAAWVDTQLQVVAKAQPSYIRDSFSLKQELLQLDLPPLRQIRIFTADAVSMYTNIPTTIALATLADYLRANEDEFDIPVEATIEAIFLVMRNNVFTFGDMVFKQLTGTAMGTPPACALAVIYMAINGETNFMAAFSNNLVYWRRFIDDGFGIWICHPDPQVDAAIFSQFKQALNSAPGLEWIVEPLSTTVNFLDLTVTLQPNMTFTTTLYEKPLNLHLYIPPTSAHPPGLLPGIVFGTLFRIQTLCTDESDRYYRTKQFYQRLIVRGYQQDQLLPLFQKAITRAQNYTGPTARTHQLAADPFVIFHVRYHPQDPPSGQLQQAWRNLVASPPYKMPLSRIRNPSTRVAPNLDRMIIAYSRPLNLGNLLSHRDLNRQQTGPQVSSYYNPIGYL